MKDHHEPASEMNSGCSDRSFDRDLNVVHESQDYLIVDKPAGLLSQPGKTISDSILTRVKDLVAGISGPILVHRLDMDTSGLMALAKSAAAHRHLHRQFEQRAVRKGYRAVVSNPIEGSGGRIVLPIRLDPDDRPRQVVCQEHGKPSTSLWAPLPESQHGSSVWSGPNSIRMQPLTGRTHQLRVHAASIGGLGNPIVGDRLYGSEEERLYLHAEWLCFHGLDGQPLAFVSPPPDTTTNTGDAERQVSCNKAC